MTKLGKRVFCLRPPLTPFIFNYPIQYLHLKLTKQIVNHIQHLSFQCEVTRECTATQSPLPVFLASLFSKQMFDNNQGAKFSHLAVSREVCMELSLYLCMGGGATGDLTLLSGIAHFLTLVIVIKEAFKTRSRH